MGVYRARVRLIHASIYNMGQHIVIGSIDKRLSYLFYQVIDEQRARMILYEIKLRREIKQRARIQEKYIRTAWHLYGFSQSVSDRKRYFNKQRIFNETLYVNFFSNDIGRDSRIFCCYHGNPKVSPQRKVQGK